MHGTAHSSRGFVRLILPGTGDDLGNSTFSVPTHGKRVDVIRTVVEAELVRVGKANRSVWWTQFRYHVTVRPDYSGGAGGYTVAVWNDGAPGTPRMDVNVSEHTRPPVCGC